MKRFVLTIMIFALSNIVEANEVNIEIKNTVPINYVSNLANYDTLNLSFNDSLGATAVPSWLNGFVPSTVTQGYSGQLRFNNINPYSSQIYMGFRSTDNTMWIFQECSLAVNCYISLISPTNGVPATIDPTKAGNLESYLHENISLLDSLAGPNSGWNVAFTALNIFPNTFPTNVVAKTSNILITSVPEPQSCLLLLVGLSVITLASKKKHS